MEVFSSNNKCAVHLGRDNGASEDTATDRDHTGERAFLVCETYDEQEVYNRKPQGYSSSPSSPP